jgi:integrase
MLRALKAGDKITEHGISAERLQNGDMRYSVNIMVDGQRIHRIIGRESDGVTRKHAEDFIEARRTEAREGRLALPKGRKLHLTFERAAEIYLAKLKEIGGKDYTNNEQHLRTHLTPYFGNMRIDAISKFTLQKFQKQCRENGLSESTINRILATYRRMGRRLHEWGNIPVDLPMVSLKREHNRRTYVISAEEENRLLRAALEDSNNYVWLFIKIGLATALRHSEILGARFDNFDAANRRLRVKVKGSKWRKQPLTRGITEILVREREMVTNPDGWVFPNPSTKTGHMDRIVKAFRRTVVRAGMNPSLVTPHIMRHTAITRLAQSGADIKTIQEFSGHESLEMVMRYTHAQDRVVDEALDRMEGGTVIEHPRAKIPSNS